jgi:hypothetical protein
MVTYDPAGRRLVVADEGEPNDDDLFDPEGLASIIEERGKLLLIVANEVSGTTMIYGIIE